MCAANINFADQDQIDSMNDLATAFFAEIFKLDYSDCLVTDESQIADFVLSYAQYAEVKEEMTLTEIYTICEKMIIENIRCVYGISIQNTQESIVSFLRRTVSQKNVFCH